MTDKEKIAEGLRKAGFKLDETETRITYRTEHWVTDYHFDLDGRLEAIGYGNLAAVEKLSLYPERKDT